MLVLEARERVGGRTFTKVEQSKDGKDFWVDLGGSYVGPTQNALLNLIDELKLETYLVDDSKDIGYLRATKRDKIERRSQFFPDTDPPFGGFIHWLDYVHMVRLIDSCGAQIPSEAPWNAPKAEEWDSKTWRQFVEENTYTKRVRDYFNHIYVTIDICADANEVSALWFLWYVKQCGGYGRSISTTNGGQERKIKGGTQQISQRLQEQVGRQYVLLNKPVCRIDQTAGPFVVVHTIDGTQFKADYVVCAISPHLLLKIHHQPALPPGKNLLAQRSPMGQVAKVILYYERPFWKDHKLSGCFIFDANAKARAVHPIILSLDETKPDNSHAAVIGFAAARGWFEMRNKSDIEVARIVANSYANLTNLTEFLNFKRVERFDWTTEQYSGGCYTSTHGPNTLTKFGRHLREPFGRIYYAGTETATEWSGYMDGAVRAGKRAARQVLHVSGRLDESQIWQTEPDSATVPPKAFEYPTSHRYAPSIGSLLCGAQLLLGAALLTFAMRKQLLASLLHY